jgi:hypothetical protein
VKRPNERCGFRLVCGSERLLPYDKGERGTINGKNIVPHGLHITADATVPDSWHTTVAAFVEFTGIFEDAGVCAAILLLGRSINNAISCFFPCLQGVADALSDMTITIKIKPAKIFSCYVAYTSCR